MSRLKLFAALFLLPLAVCQASSLAALSGSISASLSEISDSISDSSRSSSHAIKQAEGDYKVVDVADAAGKAGQQRVQLQPLDPAKPGLYLYLAKAELNQAAIQAGQVVTAQPRTYGVAFTRAGTPDAFAVVLNDAALKELNPTPVTL